MKDGLTTQSNKLPESRIFLSHELASGCEYSCMIRVESQLNKGSDDTENVLAAYVSFISMTNLLRACS
jgi:hypothetical protein